MRYNQLIAIICITSYSIVLSSKLLRDSQLVENNSFCISFSVPELINKLTDYLELNGEPWKINTVETAASTRNDNCTRVSFYVLGKALFSNKFRKAR